MWVIQNLDTQQFFQAFKPHPEDDRAVWVDAIEEARVFQDFDEEETFRLMNLSYANAQPVEVRQAG